MTDKSYIDVVYGSNKKPFTAYPGKLIKLLAKKYNLKNDSKILEMGCGRGEFLNEFTKLGMSGYGIDLSSYAKDYCDNAEIKVVDVSKDPLPYPDNSFDVVFSKSFIEHFYYPEEVFKEAYRVLKPGGRFLCLEFSKINNLNLDLIYKNYSKLIPKIGKLVVGESQPYEYLVESIEKFLNQEELKDSMKKVGFTKCDYRNLSGGVVAIHSGWKV